MKEVLNNLIFKIKDIFRKEHYVSKVETNDSSSQWIYFSYLPNVFQHKGNKKFLSRHQAFQETLKMVEVFNGLGYNVFLQMYNSQRKLPNFFYPDIIIGLEPNFNRACEKWPRAIKIYFATGAYWEHANKQITSMTDYINQRYCGNISYRRMTKPHFASQMADYILQIGSSYTIKTYPRECQSKITCIDQSSTAISYQKDYAVQNDFFFMASGGNVLKGVSLLIEYFRDHPDLTLHWVGPVEEEFLNAMKMQITPNIMMYGFLDINSDKMKDVVSKCNFVVYPSGTEGCPGAVINSMKMGLIPIVTPWAAFDGIEDVGFVMKDWSIESVGKGIEWALSKDKKEVEELSIRSRQIVSEKYNIERFGSQLYDYMSHIKTHVCSL